MIHLLPLLLPERHHTNPRFEKNTSIIGFDCFIGRWNCLCCYSHLTLCPFSRPTGDLVIRAVGTRLLNLIGDIGLVSRVGGDEFLALITGNVEESQIRWLCDTIVEELAQPISVGGGIARIGASIGWALAPRNGDTASMLLRMADQSLYNAKENGRNCAVFIEDLYQQDAPPSARKSA